MYIYVLTNKEHESVTTEQASEQMSMPARQRKRGNRMEVLPEAHGCSSEQHEPPRNLHRRSCRAMESERERSVQIRSDSTSSSLRTIHFPPRLPPFIEQEGSRLGINFLLTESNYLRSSYVLNSLLSTSTVAHA